MPRLALDGGEPEVKGELCRFNEIGYHERAIADHVIKNMPLSGYLAGKERGGHYVRDLEEAWATKMGVKHAIACNSATSGLWAAAKATDLRGFQDFLCPALTMSATAAAPMLCGAMPTFLDVNHLTFNMSPSLATHKNASHIFLTHLFGYAPDEEWWAGFAKRRGMRLIIDAAQAPFAKEHGVYAGTQGDAGVFSLNVHKHIQCGEGGIIVTNDDDVADRCRLFINHGECSGHPYVGLNLRMTEVTAAIALSQLRRADYIIADRRNIAHNLTGAVRDIPGVIVPEERTGCEHVYYCWAAKVSPTRRDQIVAALRAEGVPVRAGYTDPLYRLEAFRGYNHPRCPVAEALHDKVLILYENCAWDPTSEQVQQMGHAFAKVMEAVNGQAD